MGIYNKILFTQKKTIYLQFCLVPGDKKTTAAKSPSRDREKKKSVTRSSVRYLSKLRALGPGRLRVSRCGRLGKNQPAHPKRPPLSDTLALVRVPVVSSPHSTGSSSL
jgi:hypothetical protein